MPRKKTNAPITSTACHRCGASPRDGATACPLCDDAGRRRPRRDWVILAALLGLSQPVDAGLWMSEAIAGEPLGAESTEGNDAGEPETPPDEDRPEVKPILKPAASTAVYGGPPAVSKKIIQRVIRQKRGDLHRCYEKALIKNPTFEANLSMSFVILPDGSTTSVQVIDIPANADPVSAKLYDCLEARFNEMRFPQPKGGAQVSIQYPLKFKNEQN